MLYEKGEYQERSEGDSLGSAGVGLAVLYRSIGVGKDCPCDDVLPRKVAVILEKCNSSQASVIVVVVSLESRANGQ